MVILQIFCKAFMRYCKSKFYNCRVDFMYRPLKLANYTRGSTGKGSRRRCVCIYIIENTLVALRLIHWIGRETQREGCYPCFSNISACRFRTVICFMKISAEKKRLLTQTSFKQWGKVSQDVLDRKEEFPVFQTKEVKEKSRSGAVV